MPISWQKDLIPPCPMAAILYWAQPITAILWLASHFKLTSLWWWPFVFSGHFKIVYWLSRLEFPEVIKFVIYAIWWLGLINVNCAGTAVTSTSSQTKSHWLIWIGLKFQVRVLEQINRIKNSVSACCCLQTLPASLTRLTDTELFIFCRSRSK